MSSIIVLILQTSCHEDTTDVNASMVTADLSSNQHTESSMDKHEAIGASQYSPSINSTHKFNNTGLKYVSVDTYMKYRHQSGVRRYSDSSLSLKLKEDPGKLGRADGLWSEAEGVMGDRYPATCKVLGVYGVGEGEEDSETEEGQLWRMVQGDAPYTLNLI